MINRKRIHIQDETGRFVQNNSNVHDAAFIAVLFFMKLNNKIKKHALTHIEREMNCVHFSILCCAQYKTRKKIIQFPALKFDPCIHYLMVERQIQQIKGQ